MPVSVIVMKTEAVSFCEVLKTALYMASLVQDCIQEQAGVLWDCCDFELIP